MKVLYSSSVDLETCPEQIGHNRPWIFRDSLVKHKIDAVRVDLDGNCSMWHSFAPMIDRLKECDKEVVLLTDAWDVMMCCGVDEIDRKFREFETPIVFQMEANRFPCNGAIGPAQDLNHVGPHPVSPTRYFCINGGGMIGIASEIVAFYERVWGTSPDYCNQFCMNRYLILHPKDFDGSLDYYCKIFQALHCPGGQAVIGTLSIENGRVKNNETGQYPCLIHGNGGFTHQLEHLWNQLK